MNLRELVSQTTIAKDVEVFAGATRAYTTEPPLVYLAISATDPGRLKSVHSVNLTREAAQKLIDQLMAALALPAHTAEEIERHVAHTAYRTEREKM